MLKVYGPNNATDRCAPALSRRQGLQVSALVPRKYVQVSVESIWELLEVSRSSGISIPQVRRAKSGDAHAGCADTWGDMWLNKLHSIYHEQRKVPIQNSCCLNLVCDADETAGASTLS